MAARTIELGRRLLSYAEYGDRAGRPLLLYHGFPGSRLAGAFVASEAERQGVRVIAPERPGVGRSTPAPGRTIAGFADDVLVLADRLGLDRVRVLAVSAGAPYALALSLAAPERVPVVGLVSALPPPGSPGLSERMASLQRAFYAAGRVAPRATGVALAPAAALARRRPDLYLRLSTVGSADADRRLLRETESGRLVAADFAEAFARGAAEVGADLGLVARDWGLRLEDVRVPVVAFHGGDDRVVPLEAARISVRRFPAARFEVVEGEGHFSLVVNRAREILASLGTGR